MVTAPSDSFRCVRCRRPVDDRGEVSESTSTVRASDDEELNMCMRCDRPDLTTEEYDK